MSYPISDCEIDCVPALSFKRWSGGAGAAIYRRMGTLDGHYRDGAVGRGRGTGAWDGGVMAMSEEDSCSAMADGFIWRMADTFATCPLIAAISITAALGTTDTSTGNGPLHGPPHWEP